MQNKYVNMYKRSCDLSQIRKFNGGAHSFHKVRNKWRLILLYYMYDFKEEGKKNKCKILTT